MAGKLTSIERALRDEFTRRELSFTMQAVVFGRFIPDFTFAAVRLFVQADGVYWHSLARQKQRDARFDAVAVAAGWTVIRFGELAINADVQACGAIVEAFIARQRAAG